MYIISVDDELFCDSRVDDLAIINPVVTLEANKAGSFTFTVPPTHPYISKLKERKSLITVNRDDDAEPIFSGIVMAYTDDFYGQRAVECEGELTFLNDTIMRPAHYSGLTVYQLLNTYLMQHLQNVADTSRAFYTGSVTVTDPNDSLTRYTNYNSTMTEIKEDLIDDLGGYLRVRHEDGKRYLDYLAESPRTCSQTIQLGENLTDFESNLDTTDIATVIIPLGVQLSESSIEGLTEYLTIKEVNDGKDYILDEDAVTAHGRIEKVVNWDDVTTAAALKKKGEQYLKSSQFADVTITAKAIDLHFADESVDGFQLLDQIRVVSAPHGMDRNFMLTKMTIHLNAPENDEITLGNTGKATMTARSASASSSILDAIKTITTPTALQGAINNATSLITGNKGGYIVMNDTDGDKKPDEILVMDTNDINTATQVWRWNKSGFGYSSTGYGGPYDTAITMDGTIVADYIKAGTLSGITINNGDGTFTVDSSGKLTATGATITSGTIVAEGQIVKYAKDYTQDDIDRLHQIILGFVQPTVEDLEKYDFEGDNNLSLLDLVKVKRLVSGYQDSYSLDTTITISPANTFSLIKTVGVSIGTNGIYTPYLTAGKVQIGSSKANGIQVWDNNAQAYNYAVINGSCEVPGYNINIANGMITGLTTIYTHFSNANGEYWKYPDGLLICAKKVSVSTLCNAAWGSLYESGEIGLGAWPYTFADTPTVSAPVFNSNNRFAWTEGLSGVSSSSAGKTFLCRAENAGTEVLTGAIHITAVGRWK